MTTTCARILSRSALVPLALGEAAPARAERPITPEAPCTADAARFSATAPGFIPDATSVRAAIDGMLAQNGRPEPTSPGVAPIDPGKVRTGVSPTFPLLVSEKADTVAFATLVREPAPQVEMSRHAQETGDRAAPACHARTFKLLRGQLLNPGGF